MQAREQAAEEASQRGEAAEKELLLARAASAEQAAPEPNPNPNPNLNPNPNPNLNPNPNPNPDPNPDQVGALLSMLTPYLPTSPLYLPFTSPVSPRWARC